MSDAVFDLFTGEPQERVLDVIMDNLSWKFFLEIIISFGPEILYMYFREGKTFEKSWVYGSFKIFRYLRLSEFEGLIQDILDFYKEKTVHELKVMKRNMDLIDFGVTTLVNLHMLTCAMVMLSHTKANFEDSWLGGTGVERVDKVGCYITSLYFVTTTLSTCGFGDICPSSGDKYEALYVFIL